uniref:Uncharacterized protein n=1 Tax=Picea glauca TaxID=3330 RepID=A0A117NII3_PICGL|nr:hypothetical protein ABT39_MTgene3216 [Picea glauca]
MLLVCELQLVGQGMEGTAFMLGTRKDGRNYLCYAHASRIVAATALQGAGRVVFAPSTDAAAFAYALAWASAFASDSVHTLAPYSY